MSVCSSPSGGGKPKLSGTVSIDNTAPKVGDTLTASYEGNGTGEAAWQWLADDEPIEGANSAAYTVTASDLEKTLAVVVGFLDQDGIIISEATAAVAEAAKPALTGTVTIDKTSPEVGDTLTASYAGGNGTGEASWQWLANDVPIEDANGTTYTVTASDLGKTLVARVQYSEQSGTINSVATAVVSEATKPALSGTVTISTMSPKVGDMLSTSYSGNGTGDPTWQWLANNEPIVGANSAFYEVTASVLGKSLVARVSFTDQSGSVSSDATAAVIEATKPALTGTVTILNTPPIIGNTLTAVYSPGNGSGEALWQWLADGEPIAEANSTVYKVTASDFGKRLTARVSFAGHSGSVSSEATAAVVKPVLSGTVTINNTAPTVGNTLTASYSGNGTGTPTWQWLAGGVPISGANSKTYTVTQANLGKMLVVRVSYADQDGSVSSNPTVAVVKPVLSGTVTINNMSPKVGDTLTASYFPGNGTGTPTWQWLAGGSVITGANSNTYTVTQSVLGKTLAARVSFANQSGSVSSEPTAPVTASFFTVTFNSNGGSPAPSAKTVVPGQKVTEPAAMTKSGYTFGGWYKEAGFVTRWNFAADTVSGNMTLYANWVPLGMVWVAGGTFQMGSNDGNSDERPIHRVTLSGFYMDKYEVTQAQYQAVMGTNPSGFTTGVTVGETQANRPVERVSWYDAVEFCNKLSEMEGLEKVYTINGRTPGSGYPITSAAVKADFTKNGYRLPTEAEWEYAARGGNGSPGNYEYAGSNYPDEVAWYGGYGGNSADKTHEVGKIDANGLGLYDMSGNVEEWCWDWHATSYSGGAQTDPVGPYSGSGRVHRGGYWGLSAESARSASRSYGVPSIHYNHIGFRFVRR